MPTSFAKLFDSNWPVLLATHGEAAVYTFADGTTQGFNCIAVGRPEDQSLDVSWEVAAGQIEVTVAASDMPPDYTPRVDTITIRGETYTVVERDPQQEAVYRYLCERTTVESTRLRGRRY